MNNSSGQLISMLDKSSREIPLLEDIIALNESLSVEPPFLESQRRLKRIISTVVDRQRGRTRVERSSRPLNPELNEFDEEGNNFFSTTLKITSGPTGEFVLI